MLQGKAMSYNNLVDLEGHWILLPCRTVAIIKHTNPAAAVGENLVQAYKKALASDPVIFTLVPSSL